MKEKKEIYSVLLVLLIIGISLGYAALSTTLNINGTSSNPYTLVNTSQEGVPITPEY